MIRRDFIKVAGMGTAAAGLMGQTRKPNIVLIVADDLGYGELGCYGGKQVPTPHIDSLAANGVRFTDGYVSCPVCSPTRAGIMTGRYQQRFGHEFNPGPPEQANENFGLPLTERTMANRLKELGYATGMVGKWHLGYKPEFHPMKRGFDEYFGFLGGAHSYVDPNQTKANMILRGTEPVDEREYLTDAFTREAVGFIDRSAKTPGKPFFLYLTYNAVHAPLQAPEKYLSRFSSISDTRRRTFAAMLSAMDDGVGSVLESLRDAGVEQDTLILFVSDNGGPTQATTAINAPLSSVKGQVGEGGVRVPFLMQWKRRITKPRVERAPVIALDFAPTVVEAAGGAAPKPADGISLLGTLKADRTLYWRFGERTAIRDGDWKLMRNAGADAELYNLREDIGESKNLAAAQPDKARQLEDKWLAWNKQLMEPRWVSGRAGRSEGARRNRRKN